MRRRFAAVLIAVGAAFAGCSRTSLLTVGAGDSGASFASGGTFGTGGTLPAGGSFETGGSGASGGSEGATGGFAATGGSGGTSITDGGPDAAGGSAGEPSDASPDAPWGGWLHDPWGECVYSCFRANHVAYELMRYAYDGAACTDYCVPYCGGDACQSGDFEYTDCAYCEAAGMMVGMAFSGPDGDSLCQFEPGFLKCLLDCGTPPVNAPLPQGSACPGDGGGSQVLGGNCCPASAPAPDSRCSSTAARCVWGTTSCLCQSPAGGPRVWLCQGYGVGLKKSCPYLSQ